MDNMTVSIQFSNQYNYSLLYYMEISLLIWKKFSYICYMALCFGFNPLTRNYKWTHTSEALPKPPLLLLSPPASVFRSV